MAEKPTGDEKSVGSASTSQERNDVTAKAKWKDWVLGLTSKALESGCRTINVDFDYPVVKLRFDKFGSRQLAMEVFTDALKNADDQVEIDYNHPEITVQFD